MMGGGGGNPARQQKPRASHQDTDGKAQETGGKSMASQKFDALFGGPVEAASAAEESKSASVDPAIVDSAIVESLAPTEQAARKKSNVEQARDTRKESNVSASSGNRQLQALFSKDEPANASKPSGPPRKRYSKEQMLARFKQTKQLDMKVFEPDRIIDYADLFITSSQKPKFSKSSKEDPAEEKDAFDDMMEEASDTQEGEGGLMPESVKSTQGRAEGPLQ